jgi:hypothetical protein
MVWRDLGYSDWYADLDLLPFRHKHREEGIAGELHLRSIRSEVVRE